MIQIREGIFKLNSNVRCSGNPLLVVHPWYIQNQKAHPTLPELTTAVVPMTTLDYRKNLRTLFRVHDGPIVLFEEIYKVEKTAREISKQIGNRLYVVPTINNSGEPLNTDFRSVANFLKRFDQRVYLSGGFERCYDGFLHAGCLGTVYRGLHSSGLDQMFVQGCCY